MVSSYFEALFSENSVGNLELKILNQKFSKVIYELYQWKKDRLLKIKAIAAINVNLITPGVH